METPNAQAKQENTQAGETTTPEETSTGQNLPSKTRPTIDQCIKEDDLAKALEEFSAFFNLCEEKRLELFQSQGRFATMQKAERAGANTREATIDRNVFRQQFLELIYDFRKTVLARYFDIHGHLEFLHNVKERDEVIDEILDLRLLQKRYDRDKNWGKLEGNSSIIYRLFNSETQRHAIGMVIKTPHIEPDLEKEIRRLADLRHRNIIKLLDYEIKRFPYFVITEYVHGENLPDSLRTVGKRPVAQAADWLYQLADALDYLRHKRILHTNVRPSKIYIDDEWQIMISPFDLIKVSSGRIGKKKTETDPADQKDNTPERTLNRYRDVCQYGSPELLVRDGQPFDDSKSMCSADLYSLGLIGYKILTGNDLFGGERIFEILENRRRFEQNKKYRAELLAKLPANQLSKIIRNLLEPNPENRTRHYKNLRDLVHALNPITQAEQYSASEAQRSYRRSLANNPELIRDFYTGFFEKFTSHGEYFDELKTKRMYTMLQMAVDMLLNLEEEKARFVELVQPSNKHHAPFQYSDFEIFINTLVETVRNSDRSWDDTVAEAWEEVCNQSLALIREARD